MALTLHLILQDGSVVHEDFTRERWEWAMKEPSVKEKWAHKPDDCHDPLERFKLTRGVLEPVKPKSTPKLQGMAYPKMVPVAGRAEKIEKAKQDLEKLKKVLQMELFG